MRFRTKTRGGPALAVPVIDKATDAITGTIPGFQFPFGLSVSTSYYNFTGFFPPVSDEPAVNDVHAGQAIPIKFTLNGDQGLNIFNTGDPAVQQVDRATGAPLNTATLTDTAGGSAPCPCPGRLFAARDGAS